MLMFTRLNIMLVLLALVLVPLSTGWSVGTISTEEKGAYVSVSTTSMVIDVQNIPDMEIHGNSSSENFYLKYSEILGYDSSDGFGISWKVRAPLDKAVWKREIRSGFLSQMGNYTEIILSSVVDGFMHVEGPSGNGQGVPNTPQLPLTKTIAGWCSVNISITVSDKNYTVSNGHTNITVHANREAKIDISIEVLKDANVDRIALKQVLSSPYIQEYMMKDSSGIHHIYPKSGKGPTNAFYPLRQGEQRMLFKMNGREGGHYSWNSYAEVNGKDTEVNTYYCQDNMSLILYTVYPAYVGAKIFHDPVIGIPPVSGPAGTVVNAMYEHRLSLAVGIAVGAGAISVMAIERSRKERKRDDILDFDNSEYLRK